MKEARGERREQNFMPPTTKTKETRGKPQCSAETPPFLTLKVSLFYGSLFYGSPFWWSSKPRSLRTAAHLLFVCVVVGMPIISLCCLALLRLSAMLRKVGKLSSPCADNCSRSCTSSNKAPDLLRRSSSSQQNL